MPYLGSEPAVGFASTTKQAFNGDASAVAFTLSRVASVATDLEVFVDNVQQEPTTAYSVSGTTLTFTAAPATGTGNIYVVHRQGGSSSTTIENIATDLSFKSDGTVLKFGADSDITLTHVADTGLNIKNINTGDNKPVILTLQTGETDLAANEVIGKIAFQSPDEGTGTDAILVSAAIQAIAEGNHSSSSNATSLQFMTGASEAATSKMVLSSGGNLTIAGTLGATGNTALGGTLAVTGVVTANAGVVVDTMTLDAATLTATGAFTIDAVGNVNLDSADGGGITLMDTGTAYGLAFSASNSLTLKSTISDGDMIFQGNDGGAAVTALTLDMSAAGLAKFNAGIAIGGTGAANTLDDYEEGSFNLTMVGSNGNPDNAQTLSSQYVKVGKLVSFRSFGTVNNTGATGQLSWNGLPFSPTGVCIVNIECNKQATFSLSPYGYISGTVIYIQQMRSETTYIAINHNTATSGEWSITGCFHTNS